MSEQENVKEVGPYIPPKSGFAFLEDRSAGSIHGKTVNELKKSAEVLEDQERRITALEGRK